MLTDLDALQAQLDAALSARQRFDIFPTVYNTSDVLRNQEDCIAAMPAMIAELRVARELRVASQRIAGVDSGHRDPDHPLTPCLLALDCALAVYDAVTNVEAREAATHAKWQAEFDAGRRARERAKLAEEALAAMRDYGNDHIHGYELLEQAQDIAARLAALEATK